MSFVLGIDVGTTTVKAVLVERNSCNIHAEFSEITQAKLPCTVDGGDEQFVPAILGALDNVMSRFDKHDLQRVAGIGLSGQMHGCVLWKQDQIKLANMHICIADTDRSCSNLITWQDSRCSEEFLATLPQTSTRVCTGYGCATLYWLLRHQPDELLSFTHAGTIMDLIVWVVCGSVDVVMSDQNAASWGYYNRVSGTWEDVLQQADFHRLLPRVVRSPHTAGHLTSVWCGVAAGTPVSVAMGDNQCSVRASLTAYQFKVKGTGAGEPQETNAVLSIGTSSQLSVVKPAVLSLPLTANTRLQEVPYFGETSLIVAAALTGGNTIVKLVEFLREFLTLAGITTKQVSEEKIYDIITSSAASKMATPLCIRPLILGERHCPAERGEVTNITPENITLGDVCSALCRGIVDNLADMLPKQTLDKLQVKNIVGSGSALHKNSPLAVHVRSVYRLPLELVSCADAPLGAALAAEDMISTHSRETETTPSL